MNKINPNLILIIAFVFVFVFAMALTGCSAEEEKPTVATGTWYGESGGIKFTGVVTDENITIHMENDGTEALYWQGTFGVEELNAGDDIKSLADVEALSSSMLGSTAEYKRFKFDGDTLNFDFEIMGTKTTVKLAK